MLGCAVVLGVAAPAAALVFTIDHTAEPEPEPPALRFNSFELAWAVATAVPGDHTLRIVTPGPGGVAGGQFFESGYVVPTLALGDFGNITVEAMVPVTLLSDTTLAIFRIASTTGRTLTLTGQPAGAGQLNQRLVLRSGATEPMIDFGDGRGNGALVATDVTLLREAGESDAPWMDLGGEGDTPHVLERVTFSGASTPTLSAPVLVAGRTLGIVNGGTTTPLQARLRGVDFSLAGGTGPRLVLRNRVSW